LYYSFNYFIIDNTYCLLIIYGIFWKFLLLDRITNEVFYSLCIDKKDKGYLQQEYRCIYNNKAVNTLINSTGKRFIHTTRHLNSTYRGTDKPHKQESNIKPLHSLYINELYKDRAAPVIPFNREFILATCTNFYEKKIRDAFLKEWGSKSGIYLIEYKYDPLIYYIGAMWSRVSLICLKLTNFGDFLKLLIPSSVWKYISGWTKYSGMVISQEMIERAMEYRGSKSVIPENITVKEQRVDVSYIGNPVLRCTLMDFERGYQVKTLSNQINSLKYIRSFHATRVVRNGEQSNKNTPYFAINPWYLTGFTDAEGSFLITIRNNKKLKIGWNVELRFQITLHEKDRALLQQIKDYFGVGTIYKEGIQAVKFCVLSIKDISRIIHHFDQYPLHTQKRADYVLFRQAFFIILNKEHLTKGGLFKIVALKASLNLGLSEQLKTVFAGGG
jgi:hypothetical protein